ncbi:MAG: 2Fe-2S iron-sulfur cluster binding domain-containing protein [Clostridia bacterium]|nr:2Fe-2S iron-sulfur cluster binding domain-containing protein [Clostridia bacterium]
MAGKLNVKIKPIGLLDMIAFKNLVPNRVKKLEAGSLATLNSLPNVNKLAGELHPKKQVFVIKEVIDEAPNVKTFKLVKKDGGKPATFRAGQYVSVRAKVGESVLTRPYSLSSSPKEAQEGYYTITVKNSSKGFFSAYVMENWKEGEELETSAPEGSFYYEAIRDAKTVIGICGGSGVTPFYSLAKAVADGAEDFNLIILYGSCKEGDILFKKQFAELEKVSKGKVKVVNVLSEERKECYEEGFITADLIKKYAPKAPYSIFICGPQIMYDFVSKEIKKLKLAPKFVRRELFGEIKMIDKAQGYPQDAFGKVFKLTVKSFDGEKVVDASSDESVLVALERAGIAAPSKCRSGVCGYCRSKLLVGEVFIPEDIEGRRAADIKFGYIHPCCSYPISDLSIELPPSQTL